MASFLAGFLKDESAQVNGITAIRYGNTEILKYRSSDSVSCRICGFYRQMKTGFYGVKYHIMENIPAGFFAPSFLCVEWRHFFLSSSLLTVRRAIFQLTGYFSDFK